MTIWNQPGLIWFFLAILSTAGLSLAVLLAVRKK
jgi:hypothetical protein